MYATLKDAYRAPSFDTQARRRQATGMSAVQETAAQIESFTNLDSTLKQMSGQPTTSGSGFGNAYTGRINDYKYACKQFGVCPATSMEGFESGSGPVPGHPMMNDGKLGKVVNKCDPLQAPAYQYPMSDADKAQFAKTLDVAMNGQSAKPKQIEPAINMVNIEKYTDAYGGYDDEDDIDAYLRVDDMKDNTMTAQPVRQSPAKFDAAPKTPLTAQMATAAAAGQFQDFAPPTQAEAVAATTPTPGPPALPAPSLAPTPAPASAPHWSQKWMDLLLFFSVGIILIVLMEQIFKVAMMSGMRETVDVIMPILKMVEASKA